MNKKEFQIDKKEVIVYIKKNKKYIVSIILVIFALLFFILFFSKENYHINKNGLRILDKNSKDFKLFNQITNSAKDISDVKKCKDIDLKDLELSCESIIKFRFDEVNTAKTIKDCDKLQEKDKISAQDRKNVCFLNFAVKNAKNGADTKICDLIKNKDIALLCKARITFTFDKMNTAKNVDDCKKLTAHNGNSKEKRQDICFLNLNYRINGIKNNTKYCDLIKDNDIKTLCLAQLDIKF